MSFKKLDVSQLPAEEADQTEIRDWAHKLTGEQWKELSVFLKTAKLPSDTVNGPKQEGATAGGSTPAVATVNSAVSVKIPNLPTFNGTFNKTNEVSYTQWRYAVKMLQNQYSDPIIVQSIRQSVRFRGFDALYTLGDNPTVAQILSKFDRLFGKTLSQSEVMKELYAACQKENESIISWSCRLEGLMIDAINSDAIQSAQKDTVLSTQFWSGLHKVEIKNALRHKLDSKVSYEELITAARKVERETSVQPAVEATSSQAAVTSSQAAVTSSQDKVEALIKRLEVLEARETARANVTSVPEQPKAFNPHAKKRCFICNRLGHIKSQCWYNKNNDNRKQGNDKRPTSGGQ